MRIPRGNPMRHLQRWSEIQAILLRYGFDMLLDSAGLNALRRKLHLTPRRSDPRPLPARVRLMLQEMGPIYVKLGQIMASRPDLLPAEWIAEFSLLRDQVAAFPYEQAREILAADFGRPPEECFASIEPEPAAAASIAQVHHAVLLDGQPVVIKIRRPGIERQISADIEIMRELARLAEARTSIGREYGAIGLVEEFAATIQDELDFRNEGRNAERLRWNLRGAAGIHVPRIFWDLVSARILTMERVEGVPICDLSALDAAGVDRPRLARRFIRSTFQQLLVDGFFHADPHPANLFVNLEDGVLTYLDLGMMGRLSIELREHLGDMVAAALRRDSKEIVRLILAIGAPFRPVREAALRRAVDRVLERYLDLTLAELSFAGLLADILTIVFGQGIRLPHELALASKALLQAEETARALDPHIPIIEIARSVAQQVVWARFAPDALRSSLLRSGRELLRIRSIMPRAVEKLLLQLEAGELHFQANLPALQRQVRRLVIVGDKVAAGLVVAGLAIASSIAMGAPPAQTWDFIPILGVLGFVLSALAGVLLVISALWNWGSSDRRDHEDH